MSMSSCRHIRRQQVYPVFCAAHGASFPQMWKSAVGHNVSMKVAAEGDDWETDPDFEVLHTSGCVSHCGGRCV